MVRVLIEARNILLGENIENYFLKTSLNQKWNKWKVDSLSCSKNELPGRLSTPKSSVSNTHAHTHAPNTKWIQQVDITIIKEENINLKKCRTREELEEIEEGE